MEDSGSEHIKKLKQALYSKTRKPREHVEGKLHPKKDHLDVPTEWEVPKNVQHIRRSQGSSWLKRFFLFAIIFLFAAIAFAGYMFLFGSNTVSNENVSVELVGPEFVPGGEAFQLNIIVANKNAVPLEYGTITIEYPKGSDSDPDAEHVRITDEIGSVAAGQQVAREHSVVLFGGQGTEKRINVELEYRVRGSNAIFVKQSEYQVTLNSSPVELSIDAPFAMSSNQNVQLRIASLINSFDTDDVLRIEVQYPPGFEFDSAVPAPAVGDNIWNIQDVSAGETIDITIDGALFGQEGEERIFKVIAGVGNTSNVREFDVVLNSLVHTIALSEQFLQTAIFINNQQGQTVAVEQSKPVTVEIDWQNATSQRVENLAIRTKITGNVFDESSISTDKGFYNSLEDTVVWNRDTDIALSSVSPGASGTVSFTIDPSKLSFTGTANPTLLLETTIVGMVANSNGQVSESRNIARSEVRFMTQVAVDGRTAHFSGPFTNIGPIPPRVEQETTYTLIISLSNTTSTVTNAKLTTTLPEYVTYLGNMSPSSESVTYTNATRELSWNVGTLGRGGSASRELALQVSLTPSNSQLYQEVRLTGQLSFTGTDSFTESTVEVSRSALTTFLLNDTSIPNHHTVAQ